MLLVVKDAIPDYFHNSHHEEEVREMNLWNVFLFKQYMYVSLPVHFP